MKWAGCCRHASHTRTPWYEKGCADWVGQHGSHNGTASEQPRPGFLLSIGTVNCLAHGMLMLSGCGGGSQKGETGILVPPGAGTRGTNGFCSYETQPHWRPVRPLQANRCVMSLTNRGPFCLALLMLMRAARVTRPGRWTHPLLLVAASGCQHGDVI